MTDAVLENMRNLSLDSNNTSAQESLYTFQTWVYGYHLKNSIVHRIACELELPWMTQPSATILQVRDYIRDESGVDFGTNAAFRGGGCSVILYFAETGDPERFSALGIEYEGMDLVREAMGLPEGTKPKWYECSSGMAYGDEDEDDIIEDETWVRPKGPPTGIWMEVERDPAVPGEGQSDGGMDRTAN